MCYNLSMLEYTILKSKLKRIITFLGKFLFIFVISFAILRYFYRNVEIKALHLDDLHNLIQCIKYPDLISWIIPYTENRMHYRPIFYIILFQYIKTIGTNVSLTLLINFYLYAGITTVLYFLARSINIKWYLSFLIIIISLVINFNYYEIYQLIGFIEGLPMLFSIIILTLSIRFESNKNFNISRFLIITSIIYILMVFTHERYFPMILLPIISISCSKSISNNVKFKLYTIYIIELLFFFTIRYYHLRIWIPRGTDCTSLVDNFDLKRSIIFIYHQFLYLCGVNLGPEYLCGRSFFNTDKNMQIIIIISIIFMLINILIYVFLKISNRNAECQNEKKNLKNIDLLFITHIILCILQSSLTIRVELRWLLASFICLMFYLTYMLSYIIDNIRFKNLLKFFSVIAFMIFFALRLYICFYLRDNNLNIFIINEQKVVNSFYTHTVEKYGIEKIKNSKIMITSNLYRTLIEEEKTHFFDQFDQKLSENQIIFTNDNLDENVNYNEFDIVLDEIGSFNYAERVIEK